MSRPKSLEVFFKDKIGARNEKGGLRGLVPGGLEGKRVDHSTQHNPGYLRRMTQSWGSTFRCTRPLMMMMMMMHQGFPPVVHMYISSAYFNGRRGCIKDVATSTRRIGGLFVVCVRSGDFQIHNTSFEFLRNTQCSCVGTPIYSKRD